MLQAHFPRKILFGEGALEFLATLDVKRVVMCVDELFHRHNPSVFARIDAIWKEKGVASRMFFGEGAEPTLDFVKKSSVHLREHQPDLIVAIGGGSILDAVKVMEVYYEHPDITDEQLMDRFHLPPLRRKARFVAIPTTSGTGSEVTPIGVLYVPSDNPQSPLVKKGIADYQLIPDYVILDPKFTVSLPPAVTGSTAIDAFVHCIEAYVCNKPKNVFSDSHALEGMRKVVTFLPRVMEDPGNEALRAELQIAATMGGLALANRGSGASHGAGKQLTSLCHIAHGVSVAMMLEAVVRTNARTCLAEYATIARFLGVDEEDDARALEGLLAIWNGLLDFLRFPRKIGDLGVSRREFLEKLESLTENALNDAAMKSNPVALNHEEVRGLFCSLAD